MNKVDWYFSQLVTEGDMDQAFDNAEQADRDVVSDFGFLGVNEGLIGTPTANAKEVSLSAGTAYDSSGRRCRSSSPVLVDLSIDSAGAPITNPAGGNVLWTAIFIKFDLALSNVVVDGTGAEVLFNIDESFEIVVRQAPEDIPSSATRPIGDPGEVKLMDVQIDPGTTVILPGNIDITNKQFAFDAVTANFSVREGKIAAFAVGLLDALESLDGGSVSFDNTAVDARWTATKAATDLQGAVDGLTDDLEDSAGADTGASKIGFEMPPTGALGYANLEAAVDVQGAFLTLIQDLDSTANVGGLGKILFSSSNVTPPPLTGSSDWPTTLINQDSNAMIEGMMLDLARLTSSPEPGTSMIGMDVSTAFRDATTIAAQNTRTWLTSFVDKLAADNGSQAIGINDLTTDSASTISSQSQRIALDSGDQAIEDFCHNNQTEVTNRVVQKIGDVTTPVGLDISSVPNWSEDHAPADVEPNLLIESNMGFGVYARMYCDQDVGFLFTANAFFSHSTSLWNRDDNAKDSTVYGGIPAQSGLGQGSALSMGFAWRPNTDADTWTGANWSSSNGGQIILDVNNPGGVLDGTET